LGSCADEATFSFSDVGIGGEGGLVREGMGGGTVTLPEVGDGEGTEPLGAPAEGEGAETRGGGVVVAVDFTGGGFSAAFSVFRVAGRPPGFSNDAGFFFFVVFCFMFPSYGYGFRSDRPHYCESIFP
jgi:hypothetical protein